MAEASDIQFVIDNIEADYEAHDWDQTEIENRLDAGAKPARVIATYWRKRATESIELVTVSESGSSRGLDSIYTRMDGLARLWEDKATLAETPETTAVGRISTFPIRRV